MQLDIKTAEIYTCAFTPDGTAALIGSQGNPVALWDLMSGSLVRTYEHKGPVWALAWSRGAESFCPWTELCNCGQSIETIATKDKNPTEIVEIFLK